MVTLSRSPCIGGRSCVRSGAERRGADAARLESAPCARAARPARRRAAARAMTCVRVSGIVVSGWIDRWSCVSPAVLARDARDALSQPRFQLLLVPPEDRRHVADVEREWRTLSRGQHDVLTQSLRVAQLI